jgi:polar amino acid transport system substrate-binding protein
MKTLKKSLLIALCLIMVALCAACASAPASAEKKTFIVGLDDSFPPMGFRDDDNNIVGLDVDLATEVAKRMGMEVELKPIDWDAKALELSSGGVDCLWNGVTITEERKKEMDFSRPYLANQQVVIVLADSEITDIPSLEGKTVGLQKGSSALDALNKNEIASKVTVNEYADNVTALTDLTIGRVDAVLLDEVVARYYETKEAGTYRVLDDSFAAEEYGIGFKQGNTELMEKVQKAFDEMCADGTASKISEKWFGKDIIVKP